MLVPIAGGIVLPDYARPDLAWQETLTIPAPAAGSTSVYKVDGRYIDLLTTATILAAPDATVGNRIISIVGIQPGSIGAYNIPAPLVVPASTSAQVFASLGNGNAYAVTAALQLMPLPPVPIFGGGQIQFSLQHLGANDLLFNCPITVIHFPTGPDEASGAAPIAPTPVVT